jgi:DNA-directed RNA polymerase sigma subunit (sigma70/sigma32)
VADPHFDNFVKNIEDRHDVRKMLTRLSARRRRIIEMKFGLYDTAHLNERQIAKNWGLPTRR